MRKMGAGIAILAFKIGPKILSVFLKLLKGAKVGKIGLAGASAASYAYMFTWEFALVIMLMLFVHESGHVWAMRRCGVKTKGFYFIPFFGGAAVPEEEFPSRGAEMYIAIMGPIWGLLLSIAVAAVYAVTHNPFFAAAASWMAMLNLLNMLPVNPLDGGRMLKSIAYSVHSYLGLLFLVVGLVLGGFFAFKMGMGLFLFLLVIGTLELIFEYKRRTEHPKMDGATTLMATGAYVLLAVALWELMRYMDHVPGAALAMELMKG